MSPALATAGTSLGILGLLYFERDRRVRTSWALWLPMAWFFLSASRPLSEWLHGTSSAITAASYQEGSPLDATGYALLLAGALVVLASRHAKTVRVLAQNRHLVLFILFCALSVIWSDFPLVALKRWIKSLGDYSMILVMLTEFDCEAAIRRVLARVSFIVIPLSVLFIKYYPNLGRTYASHWAGTQFFVGVCDNKNMLGMVCLIFGLAAWCAVLEGWKKPRRERMRPLLVHGVIFVTTMWLLEISDSKTSLACFGLAALVVTAHAFFPMTRRRIAVSLMVASVILVAAVVLFFGVGGGALHALGRNSTLTGRTEIWSILLTVHTNPLLGTGFESFWLGPRLTYLWSFPIVDTITEAHNGYLEMYLNLGWAGIAMLAGLMWVGYRNILRLLQRVPPSGRLRLAFFVAGIIYCFTEAGFRSTDLIWLGFVIAIVKPPIPALSKPVSRRKTAVAAPVEEFALQGS